MCHRIDPACEETFENALGHEKLLFREQTVRGLVQNPCGKISVIMTLGGQGSWSMTFYNCIDFSFSCDYAFLWLNKSRHASSSVKICILVTA